MATLSINIPDDKVAWLTSGFCKRFNYREQIENPAFDTEQPVDPVTNPELIDNSENKIAFAKRMIIHMIKHEALEGHNRASAEADRAIADEVDLT